MNNDFICTLGGCDTPASRKKCAKCGWEEAERERRSHIPLTECEDGIKRMIITREMKEGETNA